ncbi:MAG: hypothetical protein LBU24_01695 [Methanocalculaceae archaeon]|jgi:hypothetical protein|nr:hypothetical protein [Methanocalculaceae archaeon]
MKHTYETSIGALTAVDGMCLVKAACQILVALELASRFSSPDRKTTVIRCAEDILPFVSHYRAMISGKM